VWCTTRTARRSLPCSCDGVLPYMVNCGSLCPWRSPWCFWRKTFVASPNRLQRVFTWLILGIVALHHPRVFFHADDKRPLHVCRSRPKTGATRQNETLLWSLHLGRHIVVHHGPGGGVARVRMDVWRRHWATAADDFSLVVWASLGGDTGARCAGSAECGVTCHR